MQGSIYSFNITRLSIMVLVCFLLSGAVACTGKSNSEDDTFRQSIIDDPVKAQEQNEAAKLGKRHLHPDSVEIDTARSR